VEEDGAAPDLTEKIRRLPPGIDAKRHKGPKPRPTTTANSLGRRSILGLPFSLVNKKVFRV
jgi:hypothetical protein